MKSQTYVYLRIVKRFYSCELLNYSRYHTCPNMSLSAKLSIIFIDCPRGHKIIIIIILLIALNVDFVDIVLIGCIMLTL